MTTFLDEVFFTDRYRNILPVGSESIRTLYTSFYFDIGVDRHYEDNGCKATNNPIIAKIIDHDLHKRDLKAIPVSFSMPAKKHYGCEDIHKSMVKKELEMIATKLPKCGKLQ